MKITIESPIGKFDNGENWPQILTQEYVRLVSKAPEKALPSILRIVKSDIKDISTKKGWKTIPPAVISNITTTTEGEVTLKDKKQQLGWWLHYGTEAHFIAPTKKKVLHWIDPQTGDDRFSMGHMVKGIKPTGFFAYSNEAQRNVNTYLENIQLA